MLSGRVEAIKLHDGGKSSRDVAQIMGVGRMQIQQIIKRKSEVVDDDESNVSNDRKRKRHKTEERGHQRPVLGLGARCH